MKTEFNIDLGQIKIILPDKTTVIWQKDKLTISHAGQELNYANRQVFAGTYLPQTLQKPPAKKANSPER